ncbi:MAG: DNA repair protein RecO [Alphaproteobacteria bacterium]|nr:DNA repair protein RecO [Alphaproteobacteria bacterium]
MEWVDDAIVLGCRPFGEGKLVADLFARSHGRYGGVVHGGRRAQPIVQAGNLVRAGWKARLSEQLGFFSPLELSEPYAGRLLDNALALSGLASAISLVRAGAPERHAYPTLYDALLVLIESLPTADIWPALYARFELGLLSEIGYGLDLTRCAITGETDHLAWVSPRTGRAATAEAGAPFADKLIRLPPFLCDAEAPIESGDVADALALAGYFLERRLFDQRGEGMPEARRRMIERLGFAGRL